MHKLLLMSILIMTFVLPMRAARNPSPVHGLRQVVLGISVTVALYVLLLIYVVPRV